MELQEVQKIDKERRTTSITVRTFPSVSKWMKDNKVSPSKVFNKAIAELKQSTQ